MGEAPLVRRARREEYARVGELVVAAYRSVGSADGDYELVLRDVAGRAAVSEVLVGVLAGEIVGSATFVAPGGALAEVDDPAAATIRMLGVDPVARGRGVGEALVRASLARARDCGGARVRLHTEPFMAAARRLYGRLGFVRDPGRDFAPVPGVELLAYVINLDSMPVQPPEVP